MAPSKVNRTTKAGPPGKARRARASKETVDTPPGSDGTDESTTQAIRVEEEEFAEEIKFTRSKLDQLQDPKGVMEQWAQSFLSQQKADKARVTAELDAALASITQKKQEHEDELLKLLSDLLAPVEADANPIDLSKPLGATQITQVLTVKHSLEQTSELILRESYALIKVYNDLAGKNIGPSPLDQLNVTFRRDFESTLNVLNAGKKVAKSEIEDMMADRFNEVRGRRALTEDETRLGKSMFDSADDDDDIEMSGTEGWGKVADRTGRAAKKMPVMLAVAIRN